MKRYRGGDGGEWNGCGFGVLVGRSPSHPGYQRTKTRDAVSYPVKHDPHQKKDNLARDVRNITI
jgi:hypothetical protein